MKLEVARLKEKIARLECLDDTAPKNANGFLECGADETLGVQEQAGVKEGDVAQSGEREEIEEKEEKDEKEEKEEEEEAEGVEANREGAAAEEEAGGD